MPARRRAEDQARKRRPRRSSRPHSLSAGKDDGETLAVQQPPSMAPSAADEPGANGRCASGYACEQHVRRAIVAPRMGERGNAAAEGAIHPETLRQMDRSCNELWRAAHASGEAPTDGARRLRYTLGPKISQVHGQGGELYSSSPLSCFWNPLQQILSRN